MLTFALFGAALAQDPAPEEDTGSPEEPVPEPEEPPEEPAPPAEPAPPPPPEPVVAPKQRKFLMEVNFRGRYLTLPDSILDIWYEGHEGEAFERPTIAAYTLGIEWVIKDKQANGIFYVEYLVPLMEEGYFDDRDEPPVTTDGSWIKPDKFGLVQIGANYGYELHATNWFSFMFGAGLGIGIRTGQLVEWQPGEPEGTSPRNNTEPDCGAEEAAYERREHCADDGEIEMPPVIPIVDVNIGPRFNISDRASIRLEGGLHNLPYGGATVGIVF
ncbi:MAG: hypothetical protein ACOZNI_06195 [Myxococcota bacterium]